MQCLPLVTKDRPLSHNLQCLPTTWRGSPFQPCGTTLSLSLSLSLSLAGFLFAWAPFSMQTPPSSAACLLADSASPRSAQHWGCLVCLALILGAAIISLPQQLPFTRLPVSGTSAPGVQVAAARTWPVAVHWAKPGSAPPNPVAGAAAAVDRGMPWPEDHSTTSGPQVWWLGPVDFADNGRAMPHLP